LNCQEDLDGSQERKSERPGTIGADRQIGPRPVTSLPSRPTALAPIDSPSRSTSPRGSDIRTSSRWSPRDRARRAPVLHDAFRALNAHEVEKANGSAGNEAHATNVVNPRSSR